MRFRSNLHCHSQFSDGADTPEQMVRAAIDKGFVSLGISEHTWTPFDPDCCIQQEAVPAYIAEMARLKQLYAGKIELYTGMERDYYSPAPNQKLDVTVGSVHYLRDAAGGYHTIDHRHDLFEQAVRQVAGGDIRLLVEQYYRLVVACAEEYHPTIIGHVDLITKLNGDGRYFDEQSQWYRDLVLQTAKAIARTGCVVEVNTGGIAKGYRKEPYPSREFLQHFYALDVPLTISSDAHTGDKLDFWYRPAEELLRSVGYRSVKQMQGGRFCDTSISR